VQLSFHSDDQVPVASKLRPLAAALQRGDDQDAVRLFIRLTESGEMAGAGEIREAVERALGVALLDRLLAACANFSCVCCTNGVIHCERCAGSGKTEDLFGCPACRTLGSIACDFCGGSALAAYNFFPAAIWYDIALRRVELATRNVEACALAASRSRAGKDTGPKSFLQNYSDLLRSRAVFANCMELVRRHLNQPQAIVARLVARCWRAMARTEMELSHVLTDLCSASRVQASHDEASARFLEDRVGLFEEEALRLTQSARQRIEQIRGHQHA
jgi:hypothetical protein